MDNDVKTALSYITLRWMIEQVIASKCSIRFDNEALEALGIPSSSLLEQKSRFVNDNSVIHNGAGKLLLLAM